MTSRIVLRTMQLLEISFGVFDYRAKKVRSWDGPMTCRYINSCLSLLVWSAPFSGHYHPASLNTVHHLRVGHGSSFAVLRVECVEYYLRNIITFSLSSTTPPYRIENYSSTAVSLCQACDSDQHYVL